ncbi:MAG: 16S rRNA (cytosine(1402)-N(4))-methyltransferase RsmH [Bacteroidia bacterium]
MNYHTPVLLNACLDGLDIHPDGRYVDATFGGGGHSLEILRNLNDEGLLFSFDQDADAAANVPDDSRFTLIPLNFRYLKSSLRLQRALPVDGILADLGVSSHQFDEASRGFSIRFDAPLDMRMNTSQPLNAASIIAKYPEEKIRAILKEYGEIREAGKLARHLCNVRTDRKIDTTGKLMELIRPFSKKGQENSFAAQVFQALRIEVNDELGSLRDFLQQCAEVIKPGGRLVVMSYHSLEDRLVKNFIRSGKFAGEADKDLFGRVSLPFKAVNRKLIRPDEQEINVNPRSRSAVLRIAERTEL